MEVKSVWNTTRTPKGDGDVGACEIFHYTVANGFLQMFTEEGEPVGMRVALGPGDEPSKIAGRLRHKAFGEQQAEGFQSSYRILE
jgi:hypothetical protein